MIGTASGVCTIGGLGHDGWEVERRAKELLPRNGVGRRLVGDDDFPNVGGAQTRLKSPTRNHLAAWRMF